MWENWVQSLGWEDPLEKGKTTHSSILASMDCIVHGVANSWIRLSDFYFLDVTINLWDYSAFFSEKGSTICLWL